MDTRIFRLCMIWLLIVCVPLQAAAATAQRCCLRVEWSAPAGVDQKSLATNQHCHGDDGMAVTTGPDLRPHDLAQENSAAYTRCKACAYCAVGASGVPPSRPALDVDFTTPTPFAGEPPSFVSHINPGLDRPPKHSSFRL